jgi:hypothetical protein
MPHALAKALQHEKALSKRKTRFASIHVTSAIAEPRLPNNQVTHKDILQMSMHKFDHMRAINSRLAEMQATAAALSLDEKKALLASLEKDVQATVQKVDGPKTRLAAVKAAAVSRDPRISGSFKTAVLSLSRLGCDLEAIAASGSVADLDEKMKLYKWTSAQRFALKHALSVVGALA